MTKRCETKKGGSRARGKRVESWHVRTRITLGDEQGDELPVHQPSIPRPHPVLRVCERLSSSSHSGIPPVRRHVLFQRVSILNDELLAFPYPLVLLAASVSRQRSNNYRTPGMTPERARGAAEDLTAVVPGDDSSCWILVKL